MLKTKNGSLIDENLKPFKEKSPDKPVEGGASFFDKSNNLTVESPPLGISFTD